MISYIGGKSRMSKWIGSHIPNDIETYVEVFGGAFWVYVKGDINQKPNLKEVVYNDKNLFMANLFGCMREPKVFYERLSEVESQNAATFKEFQTSLNTYALHLRNLELNECGMDLAVKYAYVATQVFSGSKVLESKFVDLKGKYSSKYDALRNRLQKPEIQDKLKKITAVENLGYEELIKKYDSPTTFFYTDPPYWKTENYYSNHDFTINDHELLCKILTQIEGKFALSYYDFPDLRTWLPKNKYFWEQKEFAKAAGASKGKKQNKGTEVLIMNYEC
jgi:DNA adenine methylase